MAKNLLTRNKVNIFLKNDQNRTAFYSIQFKEKQLTLIQLFLDKIKTKAEIGFFYSVDDIFQLTIIPGKLPIFK